MSVHPSADVPRALLLMFVGISLLTFMDAVAKHLLGDGVHLMELLFIRSVLICAGLWLAFAARHGRPRGAPAGVLPGPLAVVDLRGQALRALFGVLAPVLFFSGIARLPLTDATVIAFASTFSTTALSAWLLGERVGPLRWGAVVIGYVGVVIAIDPARGDSSLGHLLVLLSSLAISVFYVASRRLARTETAESLVFVYNLALGAVTIGWLPFVWHTPSTVQASLIALFAALAVGGQWCLTRALALAEASLLAPLEYTSLLWVIALDLLVWQVAPGARVLSGAAIIVAACLFVVERERRAGRAG